MENEKANCRIEIKEDGVYLVLETPKGTNKVSRQEILNLIEVNNIKDIDFGVLKTALNEQSEFISVKISSNIDINRSDETAKIDISRNKMEVYITFNPPGYNGKTFSKEDIKKLLSKNNIKYGINEILIDQIAKKREYGVKYLIANGQTPVNGENGSLVYHFDTKPKTNKPKLFEDGRVDYKQIDFIESVEKGQVLITTIDHTLGVEGFNVFGESLPAKPGKPASKISKAKNTELSNDGKTLKAATGGQIIFSNNRITINQILEIKTDVGPETGNITFNGTVKVHGAAKTGYSIIAQGDVEVHGPVEGVCIEAEGDIQIFGGVQGMEKAVIKTPGNIFTRFAENATLLAGGDIFADSILHSKVKCGGNLKLEGKKGLLVGGNITVTKTIKAKTIGSPMSTVSNITVGHPPELLDEHRTLKNELNQIKAEYDKIDKLMTALMKQNEINPLVNEKKDMLVKAVHTKIYYREKIKNLQDKLVEITAKLSSNEGAIYASRVVYSGTKVTIGNAILYIRDDLNACSLRNVDGKIVVGTYTE